MSKSLVLAEKPSVGRDIAKVLKCHQKGNGFFEGDRYVVTWALGHLVTLADPDEYDKKYAEWRLEDLPMLPKPMRLSVIQKTGSQYKTVRTQMARKDIGTIIIATDAGREGELVARWILEKSGIKKPIQRLWISSVTDKAILEGFSKLKEGKLYEPLYAAASARAEADWYVGMNATRALTCKYNAQLSCGRVQTPTLAMIHFREMEIQNFKSQAYYGLSAVSSALKLTWFNSRSNSTQIFDEGQAMSLIKALQGKVAVVQSVDKTLKKNFSPALYDLTELQRDANKLFGYSAKETLNIAQKLYEQHKILTYPRTDSRYLSSDITSTLPDRLKACGVGAYASLAFKITKSPIKSHRGFVDDSKVSDHHAIIPTEERVVYSQLSSDERRVYELVVKRFLAVLLPPFEYEQTSVVVAIDKETFKAKGKRIIQNGWKEAYDNLYEDEDDLSDDGLREQTMPPLNKGDALKLNGIHLTKGQTTPPPLLTEGTLLTAMEKPGKFMPAGSGDLIKVLGETGGIGTVATRADIIEKLLASFLIEKKGKSLQLTSKGRQLLTLVPEDLKSPALTAQWEQQLEQIAKGKLTKEKFVSEMVSYSKTVVHAIKSSNASFKHDNMTREKCPDCGKFLLEVKGKKGSMMVCQDRECGFRKGVARVTNARCPNCHKKMEMRGEGDGRLFICACGHREKLSEFNKRREAHVGKATAQDIQKYLKEQNQEEVLSPMAEALAKLKGSGLL